MDHEVRLSAACQSCPGPGYVIHVCRIENPFIWELGLYFSLGKEMKKVVTKTGSPEWCLTAEKHSLDKEKEDIFGKKKQHVQRLIRKGPGVHGDFSVLPRPAAL